MSKTLVVVESPAKARTIGRFLGNEIQVQASMGHVRDLPQHSLGVDIDHDFEPQYELTANGKKVVKSLRQAASSADQIYLATDPDREGEAIAWHLQEILRTAGHGQFHRITFHEITRNAIERSFKEPGQIAMDLVAAQQARRVLDRLVGYQVSPLLWRSIKKGTSAGRVQSVALRLVVEREREIQAFKPEEYWNLDALFTCPDLDGTQVRTRLFRLNNEKAVVANARQADVLADALESAGVTHRVTKVTETPRRQAAPPPFITSTLQQACGSALKLGASQTMRIAQNLYEGVRLEGEGTVGLITYLRTDSTRISQEADAAAREYIGEAYGKNYVGRPESAPKAGEHIQDAHEAIRPSSIRRTPQSVRNDLGRDEYRLYKLIWERFAASRMADYEYDSTRVTVGADGYDFRATAAVPAFDGFRLVYSADEEKAKKDKVLKSISEDDRLSDPVFEPKQHFTQPLPHYTEASLVQAMEACGIGRPSTYAPTIATLSERHYILKEGRNLFVTELGETVNNIILQSVPMLADKDFTAEMETEAVFREYPEICRWS